MAKVAVFVDSDITVRHFVLNNVLPSLEREYEVVFIFPESHRRVKTDLNTLRVKRYRTVKVSNERAHLYRRLYQATVLKVRRKTEDKKVTFNFWKNILGRRTFWKTWFYSWPLTYQYYKWKMLSKVGESAALNQILLEERPDIIIHPTVLEGLFVSDLIRWGKKNGKPTVFIMNSWDNPSMKAMMVGYPDRLVAWGEQTKQHSIQYLGMPSKNVVCLGAAQFDVYRRPPRETPADFRKRIGIPGGRKVLLYAGSSKGLNETHHLKILEKAIEQGGLKDCFVLYRPHPWRGQPESEEDFYSLSWKHVLLSPDMEESYRRSRKEKGNVFNLTDYEDTHVTLSAVDAVISPLSTILLEGAIHGKPIAAYLPDEELKQNLALYTAANLIQFKEFFSRVECIQCKSLDRLVDDCRRLLEMADDAEIGERLKRQCAYFIETPDLPYTERLSHLIQELI